MNIYAISDLHLSFSSNKPMDIFGKEWENHSEKIMKSCQQIENDDVVVIAGDISWALKITDTKEDFEFLKAIPGKKIIIRGNHDYWWQSVSKVRNICPENVTVLQNDAVKMGKYIFFGNRGWTVSDQSSAKDDLKIYLREIERLKLSIAAAKKLQTDGEILVGILHYPPFNVKFESSEMTKILNEAGVKNVIYGHLHGKDSKTRSVVYIDDIQFHLTSCDFLNFNVKKMDLGGNE